MGSRRKRRRIIIAVVVCVAMLTTACSKSDTYLDMCDEENINYDIGDLKVIKTKYKSFEECEKKAKLIYENYFQYKEGVEREEYDGIVDICTLIPMAEFAMGQEKEDEGYQNVYQVNLSTKEIIPNEY